MKGNPFTIIKVMAVKKGYKTFKPQNNMISNYNMYWYIPVSILCLNHLKYYSKIRNGLLIYE